MTLYKYLTDERVNVLRDQELRFTQAAAANDPFEFKPYFESILDEDALLRRLANTPIDLYPHLRRLYESLSPEVQGKISLAQVVEVVASIDDGELSERVSAILAEMFAAIRTATPGFRATFYDAFRTQIGILSLTETVHHDLLWSHYASQHRGFVLGFIETDDFFNQRRSPNDEFFHLRRVVYREPTVYAHIGAIDHNLLVTKKTEWEYEREWRMLIPVSLTTRTTGPTNDPIHLQRFPPSAVDSLVLGARISSELEAELRREIARPEYQHVMLYRAVADAEAGRIVIRPEARFPLMAK